MQDHTNNTYENSEDIGVLLSNVHSSSEPSSKPSSPDQPGADHPQAERAANGPQEDQTAGRAAGAPADARDGVHLEESKRSGRDGKNIVSDVYAQVQKKPRGDKLTAGTVQARGAVGELSVTGVLCLLRVCCASYRCVRYRRVVSVTCVLCPLQMCMLQACCVRYRRVVSVTCMLCPLQVCCVRYMCVPLQMCCVCYWCVVSVTDVLCLLLVCYVCYWCFVSVTGVLCLLQVCCVRYRCVMSVTGVLCPLQVCCVCYRCVVSVTGVLCLLRHVVFVRVLSVCFVLRSFYLDVII